MRSRRLPEPIAPGSDVRGLERSDQGTAVSIRGRALAIILRPARRHGASIAAPRSRPDRVGSASCRMNRASVRSPARQRLHSRSQFCRKSAPGRWQIRARDLPQVGCGGRRACRTESGIRPEPQLPKRRAGDRGGHRERTSPNPRESTRGLATHRRAWRGPSSSSRWSRCRRCCCRAPPPTPRSSRRSWRSWQASSSPSSTTPRPPASSPFAMRRRSTGCGSARCSAPSLR